ncbi:BZ3500_MvSof-1268-A1-R1_Chr3-1g05461 [Microbotryum saponariae]|uniref:BZ3500_MvSof-1268-A1-R1_Chr3-1g05461 protein n=1 Tax=Microbotryum saponariae TaxID=289078 RepID=A0A2X0NAY7_9BASI|nr:BZ3500_MvSof-1268-A1-R1_Chr3-1g05461 [Microbotryum saponariae]SDA04652.1 BZ3501_MvSof-1269-A2-R1_Chr3-1g05132 [Microbotryum saponariae]
MAFGPRSSTVYRQRITATTRLMMLVLVLGWVSVMQICLAGSPSSTSSSGGARSVQARIKTPWVGSSLVVQYLESLATEDRHLLHPFLTHLIQSNASTLLTTSPTTSSSSSSSSSSATAHDPSRAWAVLSHQLQHFLDQKHPSHSNALVESLGLAMGLKEASVRLQAMEVVAKRAWASTTTPPVLVEAPPSECDNWVQVGGYRLCSVAEFWKVLGEEQRHAKGGLSLPNTGNSSNRPKLYPFDHLSPRPPTSTSTSAPPPLVIFYASPSSPAFIEWYELLTRLAIEEPPRIEYALRWKSAAGSADEPLVLSGYGAGLDIKKSDYLAIDDRLTSGEAAHDAATDEPIDSSEAIKMEPIKKKDIPLLGVRSTSYILSDPSPLSAFTRLTSSFPLLASKLSSLVPTVPIDLLQEIQTNSLLPTGLHPSFKLNGLLIPEAQVDPFVLVRLMRKERKFLTQLQHLLANANEDDLPLFEISPFQARGLIMNPSISKAMKRGAKIITEPSGRVSSHVLGQLFDASDRDEGRGVVFWWNDLEKDKKYQSWGKDLKKLLQPTYPGQMNNVALNLNQAVFILDLTQPATLQLLTRQVQNFVSRGIPIKFGLVPKLGQSGGQDGAESAEETLAKMFWYLTEAIGRGGTMRLLGQLLDTLHTDRVTTPHLRKTYETFMLENTHLSGGPLASFAQVLELPIGVERVNKARAYAKRLGVAGSDEASSVGAFLINGAFFEFDEEWTQHLQQTLSAHVQYEQQEVYFGKLTSETDVENFFYDLPTTHKRRNRFVFTSEANPLKVVNLVEVLEGVERGFVEGTWIEAAPSLEDEQGSELGEGLELDQVVSLHVVADLDSSDGRQLVHTALEYVQAHPEARVSLLHNPALDDEQEFPSRWAVSNLIYLLHADDELVELLPSELSRFVRLGINQTNIDDVSQLILSLWDDDNPIKKHVKLGANHKTSILAREWWTSAMVMAKRFGFERGQSGVVINGRVVGPLRKDDLTIADLEALVSYEREERIDAVVEALRSVDLDLQSLDRSSWAHMVALATSVIAQAYEVDPSGGLAGEESIERSRDYLEFQAEHSAIIGPNEEEAMFEIAVVVDPATELAQRWAPIIETLSKLESVHLRVHLIPTMKNHQDLPIKRFYAFTFASSPQFDPSTGREQPPQVQFTDLPEDVLFTFAMDTPKAWLAFPKKSVHDLDNIRLKDLPLWARKAGVDAEFELENLVVEGHARETPGNTPPRGLQLELVKEGTGEEDQHRVDTIVMANLGYFQFKASPGPWRLAIREGKSSQVYSIETTGAEGWNSRSVEEAGDEILVTTFEGVTLFPRFKRNKGHEMTQLLDDTDKGVATKGPQESVVDRVKNLFPFLRKSELAIKKKAEINVFTVASGLLYERMAFLMVVSVMRHTQSTVKFWFIQNFLSPSFRAFIPHLAKEYGFEYELVTYKWPHWLRAQTEKQRTIWGYKILFLDVLFPLELERVIFVDSDQIVRTDLKQLVDLDLQGAPYAYTPMGDDRAEMDRFRFWKSGYWRDHLRGKPYHISALYVIDLDRFRAMAAGDRLRQQYQGLSADPNSLANLDQDLPNNMQDQIPIYTLDQSWLWCETWCSDASLAQAKTIDLCNNPLTHEPKLRRAKRLIPEWTVYDDEVAALAKRVAAEQTQTGGMEKDEGVGVFGGKADELGQAKGQKEDLDAFVKEKSDEGEKVELRPVGEHVQDTVVGPGKDEL